MIRRLRRGSLATSSYRHQPVPFKIPDGAADSTDQDADFRRHLKSLVLPENLRLQPAFAAEEQENEKDVRED